MNRKGIELSVNFIVILILTIVVFSFGLYFTQKIYEGLDKIKADLDSDAEANIRARLDRGERFSIPISSKETKLGQTVTFGVGLINVRSQTAGFDIIAECEGRLGSDQQEIDKSACDFAEFLVATSNPQLKPNEKIIVPVAVRVLGRGQKGTYIFNIRIGDGTDPDYPTKQIYLTVS